MGALADAISEAVIERLQQHDLDVDLENEEYEEWFQALILNGIIQAETYTGQSFRGQKTKPEYRTGASDSTLVLSRNKIRGFTSIDFPGGSISIGDIDLDYALETGVLQISPASSVVSSQRLFPCERIRVIYTYGWNEDEVPADVVNAIGYLVAALVLQENASIGDAGLTSLSVEGWSGSKDFGRDIDAFKQMAWSALSAYTSGEAS